MPKSLLKLQNSKTTKKEVKGKQREGKKMTYEGIFILKPHQILMETL